MTCTRRRRLARASSEVQGHGPEPVRHVRMQPDTGAGMFLGTAVGREDPDQKSGRQQNGAPARRRTGWGREGGGKARRSDGRRRRGGRPHRPKRAMTGGGVPGACTDGQKDQTRPQTDFGQPRNRDSFSLFVFRAASGLTADLPELRASNSPWMRDNPSSDFPSGEGRGRQTRGLHEDIRRTLPGVPTDTTKGLMRITAQLRAGHEEDPVHAAPAAAGESTEEEARQAGCSPPRPSRVCRLPLPSTYPRTREPATTPRAASTAPPSPPPLPAFQLLPGPHGSGAGPAVELLDTKDPPARRVCSSAPPRTRSSDPRHHLPASQPPRLPASRYGARTAASMSQKRFVQGSLTPRSPTDIAAARAT
ncbi:hypothetical protein M432DRAFT_587465 [Thermoascus aurantiacus ATCC 26904]